VLIFGPCRGKKIIEKINSSDNFNEEQGVCL